jgi:dihydroorotase
VTLYPAQILNIKVGRLLPGAPADLCIFDPDFSGIRESEKLVSMGRNTPFLECNMKGKVTAVIVGGKVITDQN